MKTSVAIALALLASTGFTRAAEPPVIYHRLTPDNAERDRQIHAILSPKFNIVDLRDGTAFTRPKPTAGGLPRAARAALGEPLSGYVLMAYVITADGQATEPHILKTTDSRLDVTALKALEEWRFSPAKLNDAPIAVTATQEFNFKAENAPVGFAADQVMFYQPHEVLLARLFALDELTSYINRLQAVCQEFFAAATGPETLCVVVAVRPGQRSRAWLVSSTHPAFDPQREALREKLEAVPVCAVQSGPIAFAICGKLAGGDGRLAELCKDSKAPLPKDWQGTADQKKSLSVPEGILNIVWPDKH